MINTSRIDVIWKDSFLFNIILHFRNNFNLHNLQKIKTFLLKFDKLHDKFVIILWLFAKADSKRIINRAELQLSSSAHILCYFLQHGEYPEPEFPVDKIPCNAHTLARCESGNYSTYVQSVKVKQY